MYFKQILDQIGYAANDTTLTSTGTNAARTKSWVQEFYFLDLVPRRNWSWALKQDTFTTTSGTQRYNLPRWVDNPTKVTYITCSSNNQPIARTEPKDVAGQYSTTVYNTPEAYSIGPRVRTSYSTGTVSGTSGAKTLTGSSTAWLTSGIAQFDYIQVGSYAYTVDSVDSDTSITLFENIITTISAATTYTAIKDRWTVDLYAIPDATYTMTVNAYQIVPKLDDDSDIPILPDNWHHILVKAGVVRALEHNNDDATVERADLELAIRRLTSEDMKNNDGLESVSIPRSRSY